MTLLNLTEWDAFLARSASAHILQTPAWGALKADFGWETTWLVADNAVGAQVLFLNLPLGYTLAYIPKGPVGYLEADRSQLAAFWSELDSLCREKRAVFVKVEPDLWEKETGEIKPPAGYRPGEHVIQPQRTLVVDINTDEDTILARMKQKTRYNIRLAEKKGVRVAASGDIVTFLVQEADINRLEAFWVQGHRVEAD